MQRNRGKFENQRQSATHVISNIVATIKCIVGASKVISRRKQGDASMLMKFIGFTPPVLPSKGGNSSSPDGFLQIEVELSLTLMVVLEGTQVKEGEEESLEMRKGL